MRSKFTAMSYGLLSTLVISFTGCMTGPYDGQEFATTSDDVSFRGFTDTPGEIVLIQARRRPSSYDWWETTPRNHEWMTIATAVTSRSGYSYLNQRWYPWSAKTEIDWDYWVVSQQNLIGDFEWWDHDYVTEIRACTLSGEPLATFKDDFYSFFDPNRSPYEMWNEHGNEEDHVVIIAENR